MEFVRIVGLLIPRSIRLIFYSGAGLSGTGFPELVGDGRADTVAGVSPYSGQSLNQWINDLASRSP
jgi:hypothetical protein